MTETADAATILSLRDASRHLVRELGFLNATLAGTDLPPSAVHALIEIDARKALTAADLCAALHLEKSSVSRMVGKLIASGLLEEAASARDGRAKHLSLSAKGRTVVADIHAFGRDQVSRALQHLPGDVHATVVEGIAAYAGALAACRSAEARPAMSGIAVSVGYRPGIVGRAIEMHALYYAHQHGFGLFFERKLATDMAAFVDRLDRPANEIWAATQHGRIVGTIAVDGEDLGCGVAHLRWFIVESRLHGSGLGRRLLGEAVAFCDRAGMGEIQLWTFKGLDAARRLYESAGFQLLEEYPGRQWGAEVTEQRFGRLGQ